MFRFLVLSFLLVLLTMAVGVCHAQTSSETLFSAGLDAYAAGKFTHAQKNFTAVIKKTFGHYPSYFNLGLTYYAQKDYQKAFQTLQEAKRFNPFDIRIDKLLALTALQLDKLNHAKETLLALTVKLPNDVTTHKELGLLYLKLTETLAAQTELALVKNLDPSDRDGTFLLSLAYFLSGNYAKALEKATEIKGTLSSTHDQTFFRLLTQKRAQSGAEDTLSATEHNLIDTLLNQLMEVTVDEGAHDISLVKDFALPAVSQRIVDKLKKEEDVTGPKAPTAAKKDVQRPFDLKGEYQQTVEIYKRYPTTTSPINGTNTTSNLKVEGKTKDNLYFSSQWEWFWNRWDHTELDYYKVNARKSGNYEVDIGKFSSKHFPSLVNYPTVEDGLRIWKKYSLPKFSPQEISMADPVPKGINLGKLYEDGYVDDRLFTSTEVTMLIGRTLDGINLNHRKEKNEKTYDTSGQYEQWTQAYRIYTKVNRFMDIALSYAQTTDRADSALTSATTLPIKSEVVGMDGGFDLLDDKFTFDWELAFNNYNEDLRNAVGENERDKAWISKFKYKPTNEYTFSYEQKAIGTNYIVEGAYQTQDKISHIISAQYRKAKKKDWSVKSITMKFQPEITNWRGGGENKKRNRTFQPVVSLQLPQDAVMTVDYKYYRDYDKCACTSYRTRTLKYDLDWEIKPWKTTVKPAYTFERKDDRVVSATSEKSKKWTFGIENESIKNLTLKFSTDAERKQYVGYTTKSYHQHKYTYEAKYAFIPYRNDLTFKITRDKKDPTDTNETDIITYALTLSLVSKDRDDKFSLQVERKLNIYEPWSDTSAYRQSYLKCKFSHKF